MSQEATLSSSQNYEVVSARFMPASMVGIFLEMSQNLPGIHEMMPEPFDITNHAGNMWGGAAVAAGLSLLYSRKNAVDGESLLTISEESMKRFRRCGVVMVMGATALINCVTETRWGVQKLPVAEWLHGTTPDVLDTVYSTVWGGILSLAFWKKSSVVLPAHGVKVS